MSEVTFKGNEIAIQGSLPKVGEKAPPFTLVTKDLIEVTLDSYEGKWKLLNTFPSLDTAVCAQSIRTFFEKCVNFENLIVLNISKDLPFAAARFCSAEQMDNAVTLSAFRSSFSNDYGLAIAEGPLTGLCARSVILLNGENQVEYIELVPEITQEPNYKFVLNHLTF